MLLKRLWKLITLTIVIIAVLVAYFVYTSLVVAKQFPDIEIKTITGDEELIENVILTGDVYQEDSYTSSFMISAKESKYQSELSFIEDLSSTFPPDEVSHLKKDYKSFMRGKWNSPGSYFHNEKYLAYAVAKSEEWNGMNNLNYYFEVDVLSKETNESNSFTIEIPDRENFDNVQVIDVQVINEELKVVTHIGYYTANQRYEYEIKVYSIDIDSNKITSDETIARDENDQEDSNKGSSYSVLNDFVDLGEQKNLVIEKEDYLQKKVKAEDNTDSAETQTVSRTLFVYDLENSEQKQLNPSKEKLNEIMSLEYGMLAFSTDATVYLAYTDGDYLTILGYDLENGNEELEYRINIEELGIKEPRVLKMKDSRFYLTDLQLTNESSAKVIVGDITTGKVMYEGELALKEAKFESNKDRLELTNIVIN